MLSFSCSSLLQMFCRHHRLFQQFFPISWNTKMVFWVAALLLIESVFCHENVFNFLSLGDWGDHQFKSMAQNFDANGKNTPVVLFLGDNFYEAGVKSVKDPQWESKYQASFTGENLKSARFLALAGNHDYYGNVTAQVLYKDPTKRWVFPTLYYTRRFEQNGLKVLFIMLDTWRLNGGDTLLGHDPVTGKTWLRSKQVLWEKVATGEISAGLALSLEDKFKSGLHAPGGGKRDARQLAWLRKVLESKESQESDWRFVCGHFPIHSASKNEHGDTRSLVEDVEPLLKEFNVHGYFAGHDHILQIIQQNNVVHVGSGAGARLHAQIDSDYPGLEGSSTNALGFMKHQLTKSTFSSVLINDQGQHVFTHVYEK